jgi:hypothetical protein
VSADLTLLMLAVGGSLGLCSAAFLFGFNKSLKIPDAQSAKQFVSDYCQEAVPNMCVLSGDHASALVVCENSDTFLITMMGDRPVVRQLTAPDILQLDGGNINIDVKDVRFPARIFSAPATLLKPILHTLNQGPSQ